MNGMRSAAAIARLAVVGALLSQPAVTGIRSAGSPAASPMELVRAWLAAADQMQRGAIVAELTAHRDYRPARVGDWLHRAVSFPSLRPGIDVMRVDVGHGDARQIVLRVPDGYRADRAWPLIYALHPSGQPAAEWAMRVEQLLGARAGQYVIAAPNQTRQNYIAAKPPFTPEHPVLLDAIGQRVHVDADRVYTVGYSRGAYGAWFVSLYYADRFAGAVALAGAFDVAVDDDGFWKVLVGNVAHVPVLNAWGERDTQEVRGLDGQPAGTFASQNRRLGQLVSGLDLPITSIEVEGAGHNDMTPPIDAVMATVVRRRPHDPKRVGHVFRHLHQASCYWLEGLSWEGDSWGESRPPLLPAREGETERSRLARTLEPLLGRLEGRIEGQIIRVTRRHVGDLAVWFGDGTIDWKRPVAIEVDGARVFEGMIDRDLGVCLARAAATWDFDSLRWAGVRVDANGRASVITTDTVPRPAWRQVPVSESRHLR